MKKISVIVPTYQRPQLLRSCIDALTNQTFNKFEYEIIVISDGRDYVSEALVKNKALSLPHTIRYASLPMKKGPAAARNLGWKIAKGKLIAFTDDDCVPDANWLQTLWSAYHNEEFVAYSGQVKVPISTKPTDFELNTANLERADFVTANCCCTKKALEYIGGFDERFTAAWREDSDLEFKLMQANIPILKISEALVVHPVRKTEWGVSIKEQKKGMFNALLYKKYPSLYRKKIQPRPRWEYYVMIVSFLLTILSAGMDSAWMAGVAGGIWLLLTGSFVAKRLARTSHTPQHVLEMVVTSLVIPFTSVFWQLYGAYKYRVFFM